MLANQVACWSLCFSSPLFFLLLLVVVVGGSSGMAAGGALVWLPGGLPGFPTSAAVVAVAVAAAAAGLGGRTAWQQHKSGTEALQVRQRGCLLASLSVAVGAAVEKKTGVQFPQVLADGKELAGAGVRNKVILGLKNVAVYAFGVYADAGSVREKLGRKYGSIPHSLPPQDLYSDAISTDLSLTVRLVIVYGRLKMATVRSSFQQSLGSRIVAFAGSSHNNVLLTKFTGLFRDDIELHRGTIIDLTRLPGHVLQVKVNGTELGSIKSQLLCRCVLDLYLGEQPFDMQAKQDVGRTLLQKLSASAT